MIEIESMWCRIEEEAMLFLYLSLICLHLILYPTLFFRLRFSTVPIRPPTISSSDHIVWQLAKDYCRSNPGTSRAFGPYTENPAELLYNLFWTLLFIDQEFRNPRIRRKVSCSYFVRLVRSEGGYPRNVFGKRVLKVGLIIYMLGGGGGGRRSSRGKKKSIASGGYHLRRLL